MCNIEDAMYASLLNDMEVEKKIRELPVEVQKQINFERRTREVEESWLAINRKPPPRWRR